MSNPFADLILFNANIMTLCPDYPRAQSVAIRNGKILTVSSNQDFKSFKGTKTETIDCKGKTILPGFNDAHCHLVAFAESLLTPSFGAAASSISDIQNQVRGLSQKLPPGTWIRVNGYNEFYLAEKRHPTRWDLDKATKTHPVKLTHRSGHAHVLNSLALSMARISTTTPEPPGSIIERDLDTGEPNGILFGMEAHLEKIVPPLGNDELNQGIKLANEIFLSLGITSVQDASQHNDLQRWQNFQRWLDCGYLKPRVNMMLGMETFNHRQEHGFQPQTGDSRLRLAGVKIMLDEVTGQLHPPQEELNEKVLEIHKANFQVAMHAVEENTIEAACIALEYALSKLPRKDHRHRIEHCSVCTPTMAKRLAAVEATVVTQPAFIYFSGERYLETVSEIQKQHLYPLATLLQSGLKVAASSDAPITAPDPAKGIYAAVSRKAETGQSLLPEQRITLLEALQMYTTGAAYASFEEDAKGSIAPGKVADLIALSKDAQYVAEEELKDLEIDMTMIDGKIVWRR